MIVNPRRAETSLREQFSVLVESPAWADIVYTAEHDIIRPLRTKALTDGALDPREQTGVVRALAAIQTLLELPYRKLAEVGGKKFDEVLPQEIARLFR